MEPVSARAPLPQVVAEPEPGPVVVLAPHADDEVIGCGGTLALHARRGDAVHVVVAFDGAEGLPAPSGSREARARVRRDEALAGGRALGVASYDFWGHPEGHEPPPRVLRVAAERLREALLERRAASFYAPWAGEHPLDHHVAARAAALAVALARAGGWRGLAWGYEVWTPLVPTRVVDVTPVVERKRAALAAHASQARGAGLEHWALGLAAHRSVYLPPPARWGEAFAPLDASAEPAAP